MSGDKLLTKELLDLKVKVMMQKIDKLNLIRNMLFGNPKPEEITSVEAIREQYLKMYNKIIETEQYEKYKEVEDMIIKEIAKVELSIDQYIYSTVQSLEDVINSIINKICQTENYQNFSDLEQQMQDVETLKQVLRLYKPYVSESEIERLDNDISVLKFNILWRKQVEQLIYGCVQKSNTMTQYDSEEERICFERQLEEKRRSLVILEVESIENDEILRVDAETISKDINLLERLIIIDMKKHPDSYINLLKAKIFNAHLCNIANNPFKQEVYLTERPLLGYGIHYKWLKPGEEEITLRANKVNYSLLRAILEGVVTDDNISIIECENLYKKFGFKCRPIMCNDGQECVKMLYDSVKGSEEYEKILERDEKNNEGKYCVIDFNGLVYDFDNDQVEEDYLRDLLSKREMKKSSKKRTSYPQKQDLQKEKEKVKEEGIITKDIDVIISLMRDVITNDRRNIEDLKAKARAEAKDEEDFFILTLIYDAESIEEKIKKEEKEIEELEQLKNQNRPLTFKEIRKLLSTTNFVYRELGIEYNVWELLPLEDMVSDNTNERVRLAPIPEESGTERVEVAHSFERGSIYGNRPYHRSYIGPLWKKYQQESKELGIDIKRDSRYEEISPQFEICVNLDDISDLPIDYEKVKILPEEELQKIMEREENVR